MKTFQNNVINTFGDQGKQWLTDLPQLVDHIAQDWGLTTLIPVENMSYNYVVKALTENGTPVVLKLSCDKEGYESERNALQHFDGQGAVKLLDHRDDLKAMLLQQAISGKTLKEIKNPETVMQDYVEVMHKLHSVPFSNRAGFRHIKEWLESIDKANADHIPDPLLRKAKALKTKLLDTLQAPIVLHGDLHLENIIKHQKGWFVIDPKGIIGEPEFEIAAFDLLRQTEIESSNAIRELLDRRIKRLSTVAGLDPLRVRNWVFVRLVLSAAWFIEDKGDPRWCLKLAGHMVDRA